MKKITTKQWVIGAGIIALAYFIYKKQKDKVVTVEEDIPNIDNTTIEETTEETTSGGTTEETTSGSTTTQDDPIDLSDVPTECLDGFELNGEKYYIKDNKFVKE